MNHLNRIAKLAARDETVAKRAATLVRKGVKPLLAVVKDYRAARGSVAEEALRDHVCAMSQRIFKAVKGATRPSHAEKKPIASMQAYLEVLGVIDEAAGLIGVDFDTATPRQFFARRIAGASKAPASS